MTAESDFIGILLQHNVIPARHQTGEINATAVFEFKVYAEKAQIALFCDNFLDQRTQQKEKVCSKCLKYELFSKTDAWPNFYDQ